MAEKFYTDGMTVEQILSLSTETLNKLSARDMSRALRTVSLAANKRLSNLEKQAVKTKDGYIAKPGGKGISPEALNWATSDGTKPLKFGVNQAKSTDRNDMYAEFARARQFMNMKTSTTKGAISVRKAREKMLFGETREEATKRLIKEHNKGLSPSRAKKYKGIREKKFVANAYENSMKDIYRNFRKFMEMHPEWNQPGYESGTALKSISANYNSSTSEEDLFKKTEEDLMNADIERQEEYNNLSEGGITFDRANK